MNRSEDQPLNDSVQEFWESETCGTHDYIVNEESKYSKSWFERIEDHRYRMEPFIHAVAQFTRHRGKRVLEIGVGAGTDHLQWARAGTDLYGVDLTDAAVTTTQKRLEMFGLRSNLQRIDAESLPFEDGYFDVVYSWGVIHHSEHPERIIKEIHRVLKPGGKFIGMLYRRPSIYTIKAWIRYGLLRAKPWRSVKYIMYHFVESIGTKAYTTAEVRNLLANFRNLELTPIVTPYETNRLPKVIKEMIPASLGNFLAIQAYR